MIKFTLRCAQAHRFESWFQSSEAFEKLQASGMIACAECGSTEVKKALMTPNVRDSRSGATPPDVPAEAAGVPSATRPLSAQSEKARALAQLRRQIEENSDDVGLNFVREARDMHEGLTPARAIHGEAKPEDARKLIEDGVPVAPLPFVPARKTN